MLHARIVSTPSATNTGFPGELTSPPKLAGACVPTTRAARREDVQRTRIAAQQHFAALPATMPMVQRARELNSLLVILLHSVTPPDRVGVVSHAARFESALAHLLAC